MKRVEGQRDRGGTRRDEGNDRRAKQLRLQTENSAARSCQTSQFSFVVQFHLSRKSCAEFGIENLHAYTYTPGLNIQFRRLIGRTKRKRSRFAVVCGLDSSDKCVREISERLTKRGVRRERTVNAFYASDSTDFSRLVTQCAQ